MSEDDKYIEAAKALKEIYDRLSPEERKRDWDIWYGRQLRAAVSSIWNGAGFLEALWGADGRLKKVDGALHIEASAFRALCDMASGTPKAFDLVQRTCANRLLLNAELSKEQSIVAGAILSGAFKRPKRFGRPQSKYWERDVLIYRGAERALQLGFQIERWERSTSTCAFSLVAEAFNDAGNMMVTYDVVKNVWRGREKSGLKGEIEELDLASTTLQLRDVDH